MSIAIVASFLPARALLDLLDDAHVGVAERRQVDRRRRRRAVALHRLILALPRVDAAAQLGDRVRMPIDGGLELLDDVALLFEARLQRRHALLIGAQALDHRLAGLELCAQRVDLRLLLAGLAGRVLAQRRKLRRRLRRPCARRAAASSCSSSSSRSFCRDSVLTRSAPSPSRRNARTSSFLLSSSELTRSNSRSLLRTSARSFETSSASPRKASIRVFCPSMRCLQRFELVGCGPRRRLRARQRARVSPRAPSAPTRAPRPNRRASRSGDRAGPGSLQSIPSCQCAPRGVAPATLPVSPPDYGELRHNCGRVRLPLATVPSGSASGARAARRGRGTAPRTAAAPAAPKRCR